jgi:hypothetical protein
VSLRAYRRVLPALAMSLELLGLTPLLARRRAEDVPRPLLTDRQRRVLDREAATES